MLAENYAKYWGEVYREDFTRNIMPFWLKNGLDRENGGIYTCVGRDGQLIDSTKSVWFQGRFAFICSFAYNNIEKIRNGLRQLNLRLISLRNIVLIRMGVCILKWQPMALRFVKDGMSFQKALPLLPCLSMHWLPEIKNMLRKHLICLSACVAS